MPKLNERSESIQNNKFEAVPETKVIVSFPDKLELSMVQANELRHYELFQWLVAVLLPIAVGFWTAYVTLEHASKVLAWSALIFSGISVLFVILAFYYRKKVFHGSVKKSIDLSQLK